MRSEMERLQLRFNNSVRSQYRGPLLILASLIFVWALAFNAPSREELTQSVSSYVPSVTINFRPNRPKYVKAKLNKSKLALLIETKSRPWLPALLAHNIQMAPSDWPFLFIGSEESIRYINNSQVIQRFVHSRKLVMKPTPIVMLHEEETDDHASRLLGNITFYNKYITPAEHLFIFNANSVLCSGGSNKTLDDFLEYDWISAPGVSHARFRGNGGVSFRKVSNVRRVLRQNQRPSDEPEASFFASQFSQLPQSKKLATDVESRKFVLEGEFTDSPFAVHLPHGGTHLPPVVWEDKAHRDTLYETCTEVRLILPMKFERERCNEGEKQG